MVLDYDFQTSFSFVVALLQLVLSYISLPPSPLDHLSSSCPNPTFFQNRYFPSFPVHHILPPEFYVELDLHLLRPPSFVCLHLIRNKICVQCSMSVVDDVGIFEVIPCSV